MVVVGIAYAPGGSQAASGDAGVVHATTMHARSDSRCSAIAVVATGDVRSHGYKNISTMSYIMAPEL